jgi:hypothetical protein
MPMSSWSLGLWLESEGSWGYGTYDAKKGANGRLLGNVSLTHRLRPSWDRLQCPVGFVDVCDDEHGSRQSQANRAGYVNCESIA